MKKIYHDKLFWFASILIVVVAVLAWWLHFLNTPIINSKQKPADFTVAQGTSVTALAFDLHQQGLMRHPLLFVLLARLVGKTHLLHAGEYQISPGTRPFELLGMMVHGEVIKRSFTIVEGWTFKDIKAAANANLYLQHDIANLNDATIMQKIGHDGETPEGRFAPETYVFSGKVSDLVILHQAYNLMGKWLQSEWSTRASDLPYKCTYEALTAASMIEKESALTRERPLIAGVILRRLKLGMPLQIDATVVYALGANYHGKLTDGDLHFNSAYNTYLYKGLPVGPISMPSKDAIAAALRPTAGTELYYVANGSGDGSHVFTNNLADHEKAKKVYLIEKGKVAANPATVRPKPAQPK
jgi:UPF0755 protein